MHDFFADTSKLSSQLEVAQTSSSSQSPLLKHQPCLPLVTKHSCSGVHLNRFSLPVSAIVQDSQSNFSSPSVRDHAEKPWCRAIGTTVLNAKEIPGCAQFCSALPLASTTQNKKSWTPGLPCRYINKMLLKRVQFQFFRPLKTGHLLQIPFLSHESKHKYGPTSDFEISLFSL